MHRRSVLVAGALLLACCACGSVPAPGPGPEQRSAVDARADEGSGAAERCARPGSRDAVLVAVLDSGVDATHHALSGRLAPGWDASRRRPLESGNSDADGTAWDGHGTVTAGVLIAAVDAAPPVHAAVPVRILPVKVRDPSGKVRGRYVADGIRHALRAGADIVNMSLSAKAPDDDEGAAVAEAIGDGALVVASVGNGGAAPAGAKSYPAGYPGVIGVGAVDAQGRLTDYSSQGPMVDLVAFGGSDDPKGNRVSALTSGGGVERHTGTSLSTPLVAAAAAALLATDRNLAPATAGELLLAAAQDQGPPGRDDGYGRGVLDARSAQAMAEQRRRACYGHD